MQRQWVPISLWPNMGIRRFSSSVVTNVATEPNSLGHIYGNTVSKLTEWKLDPTSALTWLTFGFHLMSFSNKVLASHLLTQHSPVCIVQVYGRSASSSSLFEHHHTALFFVRQTKKICTGKVQRHKHALTSATTLWMKGNHSQALADINWQA